MDLIAIQAPPEASLCGKNHKPCYTHSVSISTKRRRAAPSPGASASALQPEYVILGLLLHQPGHGYDLHRRVQAEFRGIWRISLSQTYNILKRLEAQGDLISERQSGSSMHPRRLHRATAAGEARFQRWLESPTPASVRAIRVAFITRLYFALADDRQQATRLIEGQTERLVADLERLCKAAALLSEGNWFTQLALSLRIRQLQATLEWMGDTQHALGL